MARMPRAIRINHVSIVARDLRASTRFWVELFGAVVVASPNFGSPVVWLRLGDQQLHLFETGDPPPPNGHFAVEVDDFQEIYAEARRRGVYERIYRLPDGGAQMYLRDPGGNLVEIDCPDAATLDPAVVDDIVPLPHAQSRDNLRATLFEARS